VFRMLCVILSIQRMRGLGETTCSGPVFFLQSRVRAAASFLFAIFVLCPVMAAPARGQGWTRLGPPGGMVVSLAAASDGTVYLGTPDGHVFASSDRGLGWQLRGRAGGRPDSVVQQIVPDQRNAQRLLAAVWFRNAAGGGVFESVDGARTWNLAAFGEEAVRALEQSRSDAKMWIAGTRSGVFRSTDDAKSWQRITRADDPELQNVDSLAFDPNDAQTIFVGTYHLPWKTTDGGKTWNSIGEGMIDDSDVMSLRVDANDSRRVFSSACSGIYRSENGGASWTKLQGIPYSSRRTQQIVQDPNDSRTLYAATTEGLWTTSDYGETWRRTTSRETDANTVVVLPGQKEKIILAGTSALGILRSADGGSSFAVSNDGFSHRVIASLAVNAQDPRLLLARPEGLGGKLLASEDAGHTWTEFGGKVPKKTLDQLFWSPVGWWASLSERGLAIFDSSTKTWRSVLFRQTLSSPKRPPPGRRTNPREVVPRVNAVLEAGGKTLAATDDGMWELIAGRMEFRRLQTKNLPSTVGYLASTANRSLLAIAGGELWSNVNNGEWNRVAAPTSDMAGLQWVAEVPNDPMQWLLGTQKGVFLGGPNGDWRLLGNGLAATASVPPAFAGPRLLIAMRNGGLYESPNGLKSWRRVDTDQERGRVSRVFAIEKRFMIGSEQEGILLRTNSEIQ